MKTKVIFRRWKGARHTSAIALFPEIPATVNPAHCLSYETIGQHGAADPQYIMFDTRPAKGGGVERLRAELERAGYELQEIKRLPRRALEIRRAALSAERGE
jgi:hypothetical protein